MPKVARALTAVQVARLTHRGGNGTDLLAVGGVPGLHLQIARTGARSWVLRVKIGKKRRDVGLGGLSTVSLAQARQKAREIRFEISEGRDPIEQKRAARAALAIEQRKHMTFASATETYLTTKVEIGPMTVNKRQWRSTLITYALPVLGGMAVQDIEMRDVLRVLEPIWERKTETASRLRQRIEAVLDWTAVAGHREGDNPARWKGNLALMLPKPSDLKQEINHPAVALNDAARWWADLSAREGVAARALQFLTLTAVRSGVVRSMTWDQIAVPNGDVSGSGDVLWVIPAENMKAKREHRVPLCRTAIALLDNLDRQSGNGYVFAAPRGGALSDMSLSAVMRRMQASEEKAGRIGYLDPRSKRPAVPHGLRSTFRDWAAEKGFPHEMAELALAHNVGTEVERAYLRTDMVERRREMMTAWAGFLASHAAELASGR